MSAIVLFAAALAAAAPLHLQGTVRDAAGAPVANAVVSIEAGGDSARVSTDAAGHFAVDWSGPKLVMVTVEAAGFPRTRRALFVGDDPVELVLTPAAFHDRVTVTASRRPEALRDRRPHQVCYCASSGSSPVLKARSTWSMSRRKRPRSSLSPEAEGFSAASP